MNLPAATPSICHSASSICCQSRRPSAGRGVPPAAPHVFVMDEVLGQVHGPVERRQDGGRSAADPAHELGVGVALFGPGQDAFGEPRRRPPSKTSPGPESGRRSRITRCVARSLVVQPSHSVGASGPSFRNKIAQRGASACWGAVSAIAADATTTTGCGQRRTTLDAGDPRAFPALGPGHRRAGNAGSKADRRLYIVGGPVRDAFAGISADPGEKDLDLTTDAPPDEVERLVKGWADAVWLQGKRFGTVGLSKDGRQFEITTHRAEAGIGPSRASPRCRSGTPSRSTCRGATSPSTPWPCGSPTSSSSTPTTGSPTLAAHRAAHAPSPPEESPSVTIRCECCGRPACVAGFGLEPVPEIARRR